MSATKTDLRISGLRRRDSIEDDVRTRFAARLASVCPSLVSSFKLGGDRPVVSVFSPIGSEPDVRPLALALHAADVPLALPVDWSHGGPLVYRSWSPGDPLAAGPLGIAEPLDGAPDVEPDVLFVPMVAFDRRGHRIGYGAGNVDRTMGMLRRRKPVRVIGLAYAVQEEPMVLNEPHDEPVDIVVTEGDILECRDRVPA